MGAGGRIELVDEKWDRKAEAGEKADPDASLGVVGALGPGSEVNVGEVETGNAWCAKSGWREAGGGV